MATWSICAAFPPATITSWMACAIPASITATFSIIESLEVLKGPSSTLFGRGTTGGAINQVSKSPELFPVEDFTLTGGTNAEIRATGDVNYVLGDTSAVRVNLMGQRNNFDGRPMPATSAGARALAYAYGLGTDTVFSLKYLHQQQDDLPYTGMPFLFGAPAPCRTMPITACPPTTATRPMSRW